MERAVLSWSGGKDAAYALYELEETAISVAELVTTVSESTGRSSMHGVRRELYKKQAAALGLPINIVRLPESPSNDVYEKLMNEQMHRYATEGIDRVVFGDIFLEDIRAYRERRLAGTSLEGYWPLWGQETDQFMRSFLDAGFEAILVAGNAEYFDRAEIGQELDAEFLDNLSPSVDPAGENGEFHTFVYDGPIFETPVSVTTGDRLTRSVAEETTMHYCDLTLQSS